MAGLNKEKKTINKTNSARFPAPPFQQQQQPFPGLAGKMQPRPDHGEDSYQGSGRLNGRKVLITSSPYGRMLATFLSGIAEFERDLISERVKSGLAVAKARGKRLGRQAGVRPKSDRLLPKVVAMRAEGRSYRWIARELGISKNTVADIVQRHRANA
uniref:Resolvase n=1 Tax=Klebsiella pneumoniae TaxID=573 RepID=H6U1J6_KLEPN|nr:resolvase [Klebsiella pneumoniae]